MEDCQAFPYGLKNAASEYTYHTPHLFMSPMERDHVSDFTFWIYLDHHQATPSTWSVSGSIMKVRFIHCPRRATPALDLHDLSTPRLNTSKTTNMVWIHYHTLRVFLRSQGFHQDVVRWCSMSAMTSSQSWEKLTSNGNFVNSVTLTVPNAVIRRLKKKKHVIGDPDLEIWLTPLTE
jgi:hypothetical protein